MPSGTTTYTVVGIDANGCEDSATVTVTVRSDCPPVAPLITIPTAFSPNGDGLNDVFRIESTTNFTLTSLLVFNRWGQVVFQTSDISQGWDGTYQGRKQAVSAYAVIVKGLTPHGEAVIFAGNVTILR
jgi:gliding motility-associated-like protein